MDMKDYLVENYVWYQVAEEDNGLLVFAQHEIKGFKPAEEFREGSEGRVVEFNYPLFESSAARVPHDNYRRLDTIHENNLCTEDFPVQPTKDLALRAYNRKLSTEHMHLRKELSAVEKQMDKARDLYLKMHPVGSETWATDKIKAVQDAHEQAKNSTQKFGE